MTVRPVKIPHPDGTYRYIAVDEEIIRALAFGAIRRAAEVARRYDCECLFPGHNSIPRGQAAVVRQAIRAAIGSDKA